MSKSNAPNPPRMPYTVGLSALLFVPSPPAVGDTEVDGVVGVVVAVVMVEGDDDGSLSTVKKKVESSC